MQVLFGQDSINQTNKQQIKYSLTLYEDHCGQNTKELKKKQSRDIQILSKNFNRLQTKQYNYQMTYMTKFQSQKYAYLTKYIVGIVNKNSKMLVGTGFLLDKNLICTCLHVLGQNIGSKKQLENKIQNHEVRYNKRSYIINKAYPQYIKPKKTRNQSQFDIIILQIDEIPTFQEKLAIMDFQQMDDQSTQNDNGQRHLALVIGFVQKDNQIYYKKLAGQISISKFLPLKGQKMISGSPIFMWDKNKKPFIVGVYSSIENKKNIKTQQVVSYGRYAKFNLNYFYEIFKDNFNCVQATQYRNYLNQQILLQYIQDYYGSLDHFLLRLITQIIELNESGIYLAELKASNLILNLEKNNLNIKFININTTQQQQLSKKERINLIAVVNFLRYIHNIALQYQYKYNKTLKLELDIFRLFQLYQTDCQSLLDIALTIDAKKPNSQNNQGNYHTIEQRYFIHKPKQRLQKLIKQNDQIRSTHGQQQFKPLSLQNRSKKIIEIMNKRLVELINKNQDSSQSFYVFLFQLFKKQTEKIKIKINEKDFDLYKQKKQHKQQFNKRLQKYTIGVYQLSRKTLSQFIKYEQDLFDKTFESIMIWTKIEELHEYFQCLQQIISLQKDAPSIKI